MKSTRDRNLNENCMDRCRFKAEHCWMSQDGTWDCSTSSRDCSRVCRMR